MRKPIPCCLGHCAAGDGRSGGKGGNREAVRLGHGDQRRRHAEPRQDREIQRRPLQIASNTTGRGLVDQAERSADLALLAGPLELALATAELAGRKIEPSALRVHDLRADEIVFLVHAANPVTRLTLAQLGEIHAGKIGNWKQVGGKDLPITVYVSPPAGATHAMVRKAVIAGADYAKGVKTLTSQSRIADMMPGDEGGIGALGRGFVKADGRSKVIETARLTRPLAVATLGEPSPAVRLVIDALKATAKGASGDISVACATQVKPEMPRKALQEGVEGDVIAPQEFVFRTRSD